MKKTIILAFIVCFISISFAFMRDTPPRYENLKVLPKNTNKKQMDSIMKHFASSLGVKCSYCHVRSKEDQKNFNFASDDNEKKIVARSMYKMMNRINKKYFKEDNEEHKSKNLIPPVSCFSCHHGKEEPENKPPATQPRPGEPRPGEPKPGEQPRP